MGKNSDEFGFMTDSSAVPCLSRGAVSSHCFSSFKFGLIHSTIRKCEDVIISRKVAKQ